ncbi:MAG: class I adenylate-forming enzyme family protein [Alphaproteobacteria bacterium]
MTRDTSSLLQALDRAVTAQLDEQPRLIGDDGQFTLREIAEKSRQLAGVLAAQGVKPGDRIAHLGKNSAAMMVLLFACARVGCLLMPLNWRLSGKEWAWMIEDAAPRLLLTMHGFEEKASGLPVAAQKLSDLMAETSVGFDGDEGTDADDLLLVYTSGSTGRPKGAVHSQKAVFANVLLSDAMHGYNPQGQQDRVLTILPMFHVGGLAIQSLSALLHGAQVQVMTAFDPVLMAQLHRTYRPTLTVHVPATLQAMLGLPEWGELDLSDMRAVAIGSTDVPIALISALQERNIPALQIYGATESGPISIFQNTEMAFAAPGSIGKVPEGVEIRLRGADGAAVGLDEPGEILIKADNLATRYWPDKALTDAEGFWPSGDVASVDAQGVYWFRDRLKNVIISGGENIYPAEIERVLRSITEVGDCCVVGIESPKWGQTPVAVIEGPAFPLDGVKERLSDELARFKHPSRIEFVPALPRNAMGKIVREEVVHLLK